jgi:hypothetical protein
MMQEFLDSLAGRNQEKYDPMETLIPKHLLGERSYKPWYYAFIGIGSFSLIVTLAEVHPIFNQLIMGTYLLLIIGAIIDLMKDHKVNGYITKSRIQMYTAFYAAIAILLTFVIFLVKNI